LITKCEPFLTCQDKVAKIWSKIEILVKNKKFGQKSKFWSKIEVLVKNRNFGQKPKFWSKMKILVKNRNFGQKRHFGYYYFHALKKFLKMFLVFKQRVLQIICVDNKM